MKPVRVKPLTASGAVTTAPAYVWGIHQEGTSDAATCALADKATSGGTRVQGSRVANAAESNMFPGVPTYYSIAVYATITGTAPITEIYWYPA